MIVVSDKWVKFFCWFLGGQEAAGITIWPFIFIAEDVVITKRLINHEKIHLRQQLELLVIGFYIWYLIEYYIRGYYNVSFEKEAYANDGDMEYLKKRKLFSFWKYK